MPAQFTAYRNTQASSRKSVPYLLVVQSDLVESVHTCVVVPLIPSERASVPMSRLMPHLSVRGDTLVMDTLLMAGIPHSVLGEAVADLSHERTTIMAALDFLISGI